MFALFSKYLLIGFSAMVLLAGAQNGLFSNQQLSQVQAEEDQGVCPVQACSDDLFYCDAGRNMHKTGGRWDYDSCSCVYAFVDSGSCQAPAPEPTPPAPVCTEGAECRGDESFWVKRCDGVVVSETNHGRNPNGECGYRPEPPVCNWAFLRNECTGCGVARSVEQDCNGNTRISAENVADAGCSAASRPDLCPAPTLTCPADRDTGRRTTDANGCTRNIHTRVDCSEYEGGPYSCPVSPAPQPPVPSERVAQQICYVCDNTGYADGQGRWRVDGNGCPSNPPVCVSNNSNTFAGCIGAVAGQICETRATVTPITPVCKSDGSCSVSTPAVCGRTSVGVDNCGRSCSRSSAACVIPPQGGNTTVNPVLTFNPIISNTNTNTSTNTNSNTNTITNNVSREVVRVVAAPTTFGNVGIGQTVTYTAPVQYTALPKTGLPELAWSALAFIPTGFGLRRFAKVKKALENHPSYIWEERQFKS